MVASGATVPPRIARIPIILRNCALPRPQPAQASQGGEHCIVCGGGGAADDGAAERIVETRDDWRPNGAAIAVDENGGRLSRIPINARAGHEAERIGPRGAPGRRVVGATPVAVQRAFELLPLAGKHQIETRRGGDRQRLAERFPHRVPDLRARRIRHLQRPHQMIGMHEIRDRARRVHRVDHGDRHVVEPDIFAPRHAGRCRFGDHMPVGVVEIVRHPGRRGVGCRALGELEEGVGEIRPGRRIAGLHLREALLGVGREGPGRIARPVIGEGDACPSLCSRLRRFDCYRFTHDDKIATADCVTINDEV